MHQKPRSIFLNGKIGPPNYQMVRGQVFETSARKSRMGKRKNKELYNFIQCHGSGQLDAPKTKSGLVFLIPRDSIGH